MRMRASDGRQDQLLTIAAAAEFLGVSVVTLRRWDTAGKFKARRHPMSNYRVYRMGDLAKLREKLQHGVQAGR